uniref:C6 domain-containing protein n=1 Tax=Acrobeloides nanus TaxID=290746 RepID=A0A914DJX4_9BILA
MEFNPDWSNSSNIPGNDSVIVSLGCNTHKQWTFSLEGVTIVVTGIDCLALPLPITTTPAITTPTTTTVKTCDSCFLAQLNLTNTEHGGFAPTSGNITTDINGCANIPIICSAPGKTVHMFSNGPQLGSGSGTPNSLNVTLACNNNREWTYLTNTVITLIYCLAI